MVVNPDRSDGVLVVDKPPDITSAAVVATVKRVLKAGKVGHTGTLDPFATGVMVICIGRATRLSRFFLQGRKTYEATLMLGVTTDTQDRTGRVISRTPPEAIQISDDQVREVLARFQGEIEQAPPVYSALKHQGTPLYKLARQGKPVQKPPRAVTIEAIHPTRIAVPEVFFTVTCSAGTYIRTLCSDIGQVLGCGGHLAMLRRIESGGFTLDQAVSLPELTDLAHENRAWERVIPMADALGGMPVHRVDGGLAGRIAHGMPLTASEIPPETAGADGRIRVMADEAPGRLLAVVEWKADRGRYDYCCVFT
jgi:tRNA pseudouridine55 synthase